MQEIWQEFLASGAPSAINVDSKSYGKTTQNIKDPGRYAFEDAQVQRAQCLTATLKKSISLILFQDRLAEKIRLTLKQILKL